MATRRFSYKDDWVLKDGNIGINSETPVAKLDVVSGTVDAGNVRVSGGSTFCDFTGYLNTDHNITYTRTVDYGTSSSLSGEIIIGAGLTMSVGTGATTGQGSIKSLKVSNTFTPPIGVTADRPTVPQPGALFYNKDFRTIEYWDGNFWRQVDNTTRSGRALFAGGYSTPDWRKDIEYIQMSTKGNAKDFGDMETDYAALTGFSDSTRGVFGGGYKTTTASNCDDISYVTMASRGNTIDFGNLAVTGSSTKTWGISGASSSTRGIFFGSWPANNVMQYVTIQTLGDTKDFGDTLYPTFGDGVVSSPTRVVYGGGGGPAWNEKLYTFNQASKGNSVEFGGEIGFDSTISSNGTSNSVRGLLVINDHPAQVYSRVTSVIIASGGDAVYFGDLAAGSKVYCGATGNTATGTRGFYGGGGNQSNAINNIQYFTIETSGNAVDFGDLCGKRGMGGSCSDSHGGLGGF